LSYILFHHLPRLNRSKSLRIFQLNHLQRVVRTSHRGKLDTGPMQQTNHSASFFIREPLPWECQYGSTCGHGSTCGQRLLRLLRAALERTLLGAAIVASVSSPANLTLSSTRNGTLLTPPLGILVALFVLRRSYWWPNVVTFCIG